MGSEMEKFTLPEKTITVRYIKRKKGMAAEVSDNHVISGGMMDGASKKYSVGLKKNKQLNNPLTKEEKEFLESEEGLGRNLSVYTSRDFWNSRYVTLYKGDNIFDLSDPINYIDVKILLSNVDKIAPSLKEINNKATYEFVVIDQNEEQEIERSKFNYKKEAFKLYSKVENNKEILRGILKIINKRPVSDASSIEWLQSQVESIVDNNPKKFVELMLDSNYEQKILLSTAQDAGVVVFQNKRYTTTDGIELAEEGEVATFENAVRYLADPKNSEITDILKAKIEKAKK